MANSHIFLNGDYSMHIKLNTEIIKEYISSNNLTKKEFCKQCKISKSTLYRIMKNKSCNLIALFRISKIINKQFSQLFE